MAGPVSCVGACARSASGHRKDRNERQHDRKREDAKLLRRGLADGERNEALEQVVERKCSGSEGDDLERAGRPG